MEFFVPNSDDDTQAEEVWQATKKFVELQLKPVKPHRICRIEYTDRNVQETFNVEIGQRVPRVWEWALVILESAVDKYDVYYICTSNRGVLSGIPVMVAKEDVHSVEEFE